MRVRRRAQIFMAACIASAVGTMTAALPPAAPQSHEGLTGVRVEGNRLVDPLGNALVLHGVNRMSTEYACIQDWGIFSGPSDRPGNAATLHAMAQWRINAVRVPLNEQCWLDRETSGLDRRYVGPAYRAAITEWVSQITGMGMVAILDLHFSAPRGVRAKTQQPMADADNSPDFWRSAAATFKDDPLVIFDVFNEPYIDRDEPAPADPWKCWRDGCTVFLHAGDKQVQTDQRYEAAGMQALVDAVRSTGATNPIMLGGLRYADRLDGLVEHLPRDPLGQLIAAWHPYPGNECGLGTTECWEGAVAAVMAKMPVIAGEFGRSDCSTDDLDRFMRWMDDRGGSYLAWVWTVVDTETCPPPGEPGKKFDLIADYDSGAPANPYGAAIRRHYQRR